MSAAAPATPAAAAAAPASAAAGSPAKPGTASGMRSPKGKAPPKSAAAAAAAAPAEAEQPVVFKGNARAKKVFKAFDGDKDKFLSKAEFEDGLTNFVNGPGMAPVTAEQLEALWLEADINKDGKVSWAEFNHRFCGGPHPSTLVKKVEKKLSLHLQTLKKKVELTGKGAAVNELRNVLEATYNGSKVRFKEVDLSKSKALNPPGLKKLLTQLLAEEKAAAKEAKRPVESWALPFQTGPGVDQKVVDRLFVQLDTSKSGKLDLTSFFEQLKLRPSTGPVGGKGGKSKKKKEVKHGSGPQAYVLTTVKAEHVRDFVSESLLKHMPDNVAHSVKCHPPLKHWGDDERRKKGLATEGYRTTIFLSERTKVKAVVKLPPTEPLSPSPATAAIEDKKSPVTSSRTAASSSRPRAGSAAAASAAAKLAAAAAAAALPPVNHSDVLIFAAYRTEYTAMARTEQLWHARITMDEDEVIKVVDLKLKKTWVDGELDVLIPDADFDDWTTYVGHEDDFDEMSIPAIA